MPNEKNGKFNKQKCGVIMPISETDGCASAHWKDVFAIIGEALEKTQLQIELIGEDRLSGVVQKASVSRLLSDPIVICDISGTSPSVLLGLGMRLAFDKPVIVIKDDATEASFGDSPLEVIRYPRNLRFSEIIAFKGNLGRAVVSACEASRGNGCKTFLSRLALPANERPVAEMLMKTLVNFSIPLSIP